MLSIYYCMHVSKRVAAAKIIKTAKKIITVFCQFLALRVNHIQSMMIVL